MSSDFGDKFGSSRLIVTFATNIRLILPATTDRALRDNSGLK